MEISYIIKTGSGSQRPPSKLTGPQNYDAASCGVFGLHSISVVAKQVPLALSNPRGSRQISMQAGLLGSLLRGNKIRRKFRMIHNLPYKMRQRLKSQCRILYIQGTGKVRPPIFLKPKTSLPQRAAIMLRAASRQFADRRCFSPYLSWHNNLFRR